MSGVLLFTCLCASLSSSLPLFQKYIFALTKNDKQFDKFWVIFSRNGNLILLGVGTGACLLVHIGRTDGRAAAAVHDASGGSGGAWWRLAGWVYGRQAKNYCAQIYV